MLFLAEAGTYPIIQGMNHWDIWDVLNCLNCLNLDLGLSQNQPLGLFPADQAIPSPSLLDWVPGLPGEGLQISPDVCRLRHPGPQLLEESGRYVRQVLQRYARNHRTWICFLAKISLVRITEPKICRFFCRHGICLKNMSEDHVVMSQITLATCKLGHVLIWVSSKMGYRFNRWSYREGNDRPLDLADTILDLPILWPPIQPRDSSNSSDMLQQSATGAPCVCPNEKMV